MSNYKWFLNAASQLLLAVGHTVTVTEIATITATFKHDPNYKWIGKQPNHFDHFKLPYYFFFFC